MDGSVLALPSAAAAVERVARALGHAGIASAVWPVVGARGILPPAYVYVPSALTASHTDRFARTRPTPKQRRLASSLTAEARQALLGAPVLGAAPGPSWLAGLPSNNRAVIRSALHSADPLTTAYVALQVENQTVGVLGVAGHRVNAGVLNSLSVLSADLAQSLEMSEVHQSDTAHPLAQRMFAQRLLEEVTQPLTSLVARAEVMLELIREGEMNDVVLQLAAMHDAAERLAAWTDVTGHLLKQDFNEPPLN
jgi:hypothetical protein